MTPSRPKMHRLLIWAGVLTVLAAAAITLFLKIGEWLVVQDTLVHADAIVVLSGQLPERALEASRLYHAGYSDQVWISQGVSPAELLKTMKIYYLGEDFFNERVLIAQGVPVDAIHILEEPAANTEEEVSEISASMRRNDFHSAIVITSKPHTRRVRAIWSRLVRSDLRVMVHYANDDPYDGAHWWRHTHDGLDVVRETLGLLNTWAGFPVRPSRN